MKHLPLGPTLFFLGVFGGGLLWLALIGLRFDYLITEVYNGGGPGEAIWSIDPLFTILAAVPAIILVFVGLIESFKSTSEMHSIFLNLFYLGEICLLVTIVVSCVEVLGISSLAVEVVDVSAILMGAIVITSIIHMFSFIPSESVNRLNSFKLLRNTGILLAAELLTLFLVVVILRLFTWSFIRATSLVVISSGTLGLLLLSPRLLTQEIKNGAEGEICSGSEQS